MIDSDDSYVLCAKDIRIVRATEQLLKKIVKSDFVRPSELISIAKALHVLSALPQSSVDVTLTIDLNGPRRWFNDHEIWHWWQLSIEPRCISITSGGHFYRKSTGGDTFTCMSWTAQPGYEAELNDYLHTLSIVDDAKAYEPEVDELDLDIPGYSLDVSDEENHLLDLDDDGHEEGCDRQERG